MFLLVLKILNDEAMMYDYAVFPKSTGLKALSSKNLSGPVYYTMSLDRMSSTICLIFWPGPTKNSTLLDRLSSDMQILFGKTDYACIIKFNHITIIYVYF